MYKRKIKNKKEIKKSSIFNEKLYKNIIILMSIFVIILISFVFAYKILKPWEIEYSLKSDPIKENMLSVNMRIKRNKILGLKSFSFLKGDFDAVNLECVDDKGKNVSVDYKDGIVRIGPVARDVKYIDYSYEVKVGELGKHGHRGAMYNDLLTFDGESVFVFPLESVYGSDKEIKSIVKKVTIKFDVPKDWQAVIPFNSTADIPKVSNTIYISRPSWKDLYELRKAAYAFGKFDREVFNKDKGALIIYTDPQSKLYLTNETREGINALYDYYSKLFNYNLNNLSIVLLRKDNKDGLYIMGGIGTQTVGTTFDPGSSRDWQLMGHRLFHVFFDSIISTDSFHKPDKLWFYEGLATYYENVAMDSLPEKMRKDLALSSLDSLDMIYKRYLYMRLKEPELLSISPLEEDKMLGSSGVAEFVHYTQAPLIIKGIEDASFSEYKEHDRALKYIVKNRLKNDIGLRDIIRYSTGKKSNQFEQDFIYSKDIIPLWNSFEKREEDSAEVIEKLNDFEHLIWTWFRLEIPGYPQDMLSQKKLNEISAYAQKMGIHFSSPEIEERVKMVSPTVYHLLKGYALRASVCGVDYNDPLIRFKLLANQSNVRHWEEFKESLN